MFFKSQHFSLGQINSNTRFKFKNLILLFVLVFPLLFIINSVQKKQDTRSSAAGSSANKITFKFSIDGVGPLSSCLVKTGNLTFDIINPISKSSQSSITTSFSPINGVVNSKGYQVFQTKEIILNSDFSSINNFNYIKINIPFVLKSVLCADKQKEEKSDISACNLNLTNDMVYDFSEYPLISGDINNDGVDNAIDLSYIKNKINPSLDISCGIDADINYDGVVNGIDFSLIKKNLLASDEEIQTSIDIVATPTLTITPTKSPTSIPTVVPTITQTISPTEKPTNIPTITPTSSVAIKILFVGNSKTYRPTIAYQSIADIFSNMAKSGGYSVDVTKAAIDGSTLANTASVKQSVITSKAFDIVVLQEQTGTIEKADTSTFLNGAEKIRKLVTSKNSSVRLFLRTSWGLKTNLGTSIQTRMFANVDTVASNINATVIPDGRAFDASLKTYPSINMYSDNTHQSKEGAYLASACIYKIVFRSDPRQLSYYGYVDESTAKKMQEIANDTCK